MENKKYRTNVEILGESYTIRGEIDPARMMKIAGMLDEKMREIARNFPRLSPNKIAVLAALNIAEEYSRLEEDYQDLLKMVHRSR